MTITKENLENLFQKSKARYEGLRDVDVRLRFRRELFFTMRASIQFSSFFQSKRTYFVYVNWRKKSFLEQLSEDDITGWFGHELAHIVDYETMSNTALVVFIAKYIFNPKFRFSVEKRINAFTYNNGFATELFGVWKKFLSLDSVPKKYKEYIRNNYRPYWEDIQQTAQIHGIIREAFESFK